MRKRKGNRAIRPLFWLWLLMLPGACQAPTLETENTSASPNIIVILTDDQGYGDLGSYGSQTIRTPHIDQLANEGILFTDFYVHPICSPSRAALMTGSYAPRTGFADVQLWGSPFGLHPDEVTIAEVLKTKGYATAAVGKWHLGEQDAFAPNRQGFDFFYGIRLVNGTQPFENFAVPLYRDDSLLTIRPDHSRMTQDFTRASLRFIDEHKEGPFFLYLAFTMPHIPIYPGEGFRGKSGVSLYADVIEESTGAWAKSSRNWSRKTWMKTRSSCIPPTTARGPGTENSRAVRGPCEEAKYRPGKEEFACLRS